MKDIWIDDKSHILYKLTRINGSCDIFGRSRRGCVYRGPLVTVGPCRKVLSLLTLLLKLLLLQKLLLLKSVGVATVKVVNLVLGPVL